LVWAAANSRQQNPEFDPESLGAILSHTSLVPQFKINKQINHLQPFWNCHQVQDPC
jgi:hypothetical protein